MAKQADFNAWNSEHLAGKGYLAPNTKAASAWIADNLKGNALDAAGYQCGHAELETLLTQIESAGLVVAFSKPAY